MDLSIDRLDNMRLGFEYFPMTDCALQQEPMQPSWAQGLDLAFDRSAISSPCLISTAQRSQPTTSQEASSSMSSLDVKLHQTLALPLNILPVVDALQFNLSHDKRPVQNIPIHLFVQNVLNSTPTFQQFPQDFAPTGSFTGDQLHRLCTKIPSGDEQEAGIVILRAIQRILEINPQAISRPCTAYKTRDVWSPQACKLLRQKVKLTYVYPLHLAINNRKMPLAVLRFLIHQAHQSGACNDLLRQDGAMHETPLHLILKRRPTDTKLLDELLLECPQAINVVDRHNNTALHVACQYGAPLASIRHLHILHPNAVVARNLHGVTPFQIALRRTTAVEDVLDFFADADAAERQL